MLPQDLKKLKAQDPELKVFINGDAKANFESAIKVLDEVRLAGITKVAIQTKGPSVIMTYIRSIILWDDIHKRDERIGFISSLFVHALLFFIGGAIFVKTAQYNVQNVPESTTVELVEAVQPPPVVEDIAPPKPIEKPVEVKKTC